MLNISSGYYLLYRNIYNFRLIIYGIKRLVRVVYLGFFERISSHITQPLCEGHRPFRTAKLKKGP